MNAVKCFFAFYGSRFILILFEMRSTHFFLGKSGFLAYPSLMEPADPNLAIEETKPYQLVVKPRFVAGGRPNYIVLPIYDHYSRLVWGGQARYLSRNSRIGVG